MKYHTCENTFIFALDMRCLINLPLLTFQKCIIDFTLKENDIPVMLLNIH